MGGQRAQRWQLWSGCCEPYVLWAPGGAGVRIDEAPVSDALKDDLRQWHEFVAVHVGPDGWDSAQAEELHARRGRGLRAWLERELDEPVDLDVSADRVGW